MEQDMDEPEAVKVLRAKHSSGDALPYELRILEYIDSLRAALVEAERELETQRAHSIDAAFKHVDIAKRAEQAESALAAAKEKVERETIERCAKAVETLSIQIVMDYVTQENLARMGTFVVEQYAQAIRALQSSGDKT
jgi:hypothetical protein